MIGVQSSSPVITMYVFSRQGHECVWYNLSTALCPHRLVKGVDEKDLRFFHALPPCVFSVLLLALRLRVLLLIVIKSRKWCAPSFHLWVSAINRSSTNGPKRRRESIPLGYNPSPMKNVNLPLKRDLRSVTRDYLTGCSKIIVRSQEINDRNVALPCCNESWPGID